VFSEGRVLLSKALSTSLEFKKYYQTLICAATFDEEYNVCRFKCDVGVQCSGQSTSAGNMA
jgi:hypothetical protein